LCQPICSLSIKRRGDIAGFTRKPVLDRLVETPQELVALILGAQTQFTELARAVFFGGGARPPEAKRHGEPERLPYSRKEVHAGFGVAELNQLCPNSASTQ